MNRVQLTREGPHHSQLGQAGRAVRTDLRTDWTSQHVGRLEQPK